MSEINRAVEDLLENESIDPVREMLEDEETAHAYLLERWLTDAVAKLRDARREAGLTQEELAQRLGTKQPAIARLERDHEGRFSLRRFVEYALACGALPLDATLRPSEDVREYALVNPNEPITETPRAAWSSGLETKSTTPVEQESGKVHGNWSSFLSYSHEPSWSADRRYEDLCADSVWRDWVIADAPRQYGSFPHKISEKVSSKRTTRGIETHCKGQELKVAS